LNLVLARRSIVAVLWVAVAIADDGSGTSDAARGTKRDTSSYVLGPNDLIGVVVPDAEDISARPYRIDTGGALTLPLVGSVRAAGLTVRELELELAEKLSSYMKAPQVLITVTEFRSQPVSIIGAVNSPGVHQLYGSKRLIEVLSLAGGLRPDAGRICRITRTGELNEDMLKRFAPSSDGLHVAEVDLQSLLAAEKPTDNLIIRPHDVVSVSRADTIYVIGDVGRPGSFLLNDREPLSVLQAIALAGGVTPGAAPKKARILRLSPPNSEREEVPVNITAIMTGKSPDVKLTPQDILFIPNNAPKRVAIRATEAAVQTLTGIVIWRSAR